ncbi:MAG: hypothetical protein AB1714_01245 [Acidobacteriota bacterium]
MPAAKQPCGSISSAGTITIPSGHILSGKVLPPSGSVSVLTALLWTLATNGGTFAYHLAQFGTDATNFAQYAIALPSGSYKTRLIPVMVFSSSFQPVPAAFTTSNFTISGDKTLNLKLKKGYKLSGTVIDSAGRIVESSRRRPGCRTAGAGDLAARLLVRDTGLQRRISVERTGGDRGEGGGTHQYAVDGRSNIAAMRLDRALAGCPPHHRQLSEFWMDSMDMDPR